MFSYEFCEFFKDIFSTEPVWPSKHFLFSNKSWKRLEDVFSVTLFIFQNLLKTSSRRLQDVFAICLPEMSSRLLQDVFKTSSKTSSRRVCKTSSRRLRRQKKNVTLKTCSRRLQEVFNTSSPRRMFAGGGDDCFWTKCTC